MSKKQNKRYLVKASAREQAAVDGGGWKMAEPPTAAGLRELRTPGGGRLSGAQVRSMLHAAALQKPLPRNEQRQLLTNIGLQAKNLDALLGALSAGADHADIQMREALIDLGRRHAPFLNELRASLADLGRAAEVAAAKLPPSPGGRPRKLGQRKPG